jgi:hypothetical protein
MTKGLLALLSASLSLAKTMGEALRPVARTDPMTTEIMDFLSCTVGSPLNLEKILCHSLTGTGADSADPAAHREQGILPG